jgi:hypothetical protein
VKKIKSTAQEQLDHRSSIVHTSSLASLSISLTLKAKRLCYAEGYQAERYKLVTDCQIRMEPLL